MTYCEGAVESVPHTQTNLTRCLPNDESFENTRTPIPSLFSRAFNDTIVSISAFELSTFVIFWQHVSHAVVNHDATGTEVTRVRTQMEI